MKIDKVVDAPIWGVTTQNSDLRVAAGYSAGGTFTALRNPLRGTLLWDRCMYVLKNVAVAGGATGGSYTVTIETDAVEGYTALPIAQASLGPGSATTVVMDNLHQSPGSPLPTHINIDQTAAGGGVTLNCVVVAKQYRGVLGTPGQNTSERIIQGNMLETSMADYGGAGISADATLAIGSSASDRGMHRIRLWDTAFFWLNGNTLAGTHDADIIATINGTTTVIASTGVGGALNTDGEKIALSNNFYGQCPNPSAVIWTEVTAGGCSNPAVIVLAKTGRGSLAKR